MRRILLIVLGSVSLGLGVIGIFLPVLPTTPFVLGAAGCFAGSSPSLYRWLAGTKYFGEYVRNYREKTGISRKTRVVAICYLWAGLLLSAVLLRHVHVWIMLGVVGVAVTIHILMIRRKKAVKKSEEAEVKVELEK